MLDKFEITFGVYKILSEMCIKHNKFPFWLQTIIAYFSTHPNVHTHAGCYAFNCSEYGIPWVGVGFTYYCGEQYGTRETETGVLSMD